MRKVWLILVSLLVIMGLTLGGCVPEGCAPGIGFGGGVAELEKKLDWIKDKLQSMQVELGELEELEKKLDWVEGKLRSMQTTLEDLEDKLEVIVPGPPVVGAEKLVGVGMLGSETDDQWWETLFIITNPDSEENITVDKVVITREDETLIYSGPYLVYERGEMEKPIDQVLTPHEVWQLWLSQYKYNPETERWIDPDKALSQEMEKYTVEVFWHAEDDTCPLSGWFKQIKTYVLYDYECVAFEWQWDYEYEKERLVCVEWEEFEGHHKAVTEASMVNVRQVH